MSGGLKSQRGGLLFYVHPVELVTYVSNEKRVTNTVNVAEYALHYIWHHACFVQLIAFILMIIHKELLHLQLVFLGPLGCIWRAYFWEREEEGDWVLFLSLDHIKIAFVALTGVKAGMVRVWVAGKTVWSSCYTRPYMSAMRWCIMIKRYRLLYLQ